MKTEQQLIDGLRKRKTRIISYSVALVVATIMLMVGLNVFDQGMSTLRDLGKFHPDRNISTEAFIQNTPEVISSYAVISVTVSRTYTLLIMIAAMVGLLLGMLIVELAGQNKDRVIIKMWDDIQELKRKVEPPAAG